MNAVDMHYKITDYVCTRRILLKFLSSHGQLISAGCKNFMTFTSGNVAWWICLQFNPNMDKLSYITAVIVTFNLIIWIHNVRDKCGIAFGIPLLS